MQLGESSEASVKYQQARKSPGSDSDNLDLESTKNGALKRSADEVLTAFVGVRDALTQNQIETKTGMRTANAKRACRNKNKEGA
jgi:hypothetical protein